MHLTDRKIARHNNGQDDSKITAAAKEEKAGPTRLQGVGRLGTWGDLTALLTTVSGRGENRENILLTAFRRRGTVVMQIDLV